MASIANTLKSFNVLFSVFKLLNNCIILETGNHFSSVERDFYSIKWAHQMTGVLNPCISEVIKNIVEASKRKLCRKYLMDIEDYLVSK
jgi:hypothetical protein